MYTITLTGTPMSTGSLYRKNASSYYMKEAGKDRKKDYQWEAKSQWKGKPLAKILKITVHLFFPDRRKRDWDNFHKISMDSLTGIVWNDDSQISDARVIKYLDKKNPRMVIEIEEIPYVVSR